MSEGATLYLDLLKKCVSNFIYDDDLDLMRAKHVLDPRSGKFTTAEPAPFAAPLKYYGAIWPSRAHTMIGTPRLNNLQHCVEEVLRTGVPGDLIETGVWRGGAAIFMRGILKAYGVTDRRVWAADSFEGLPLADPVRYPKETNAGLHRYEALAVSLEEVKANFERYGLLDDQIRFLKGWFRDTLPTAPIDQLAVMRLDGDMYESTMDALVNLYAKLSPGGFVIIDDYDALQSCNAAVDDFRGEWNIATELVKIPGKGAFWKKQAVTNARSPGVHHQQQHEQLRTRANAAVEAKVQKALSFHQRGALADAERLYREILAQVPKHFDALHLLGVTQHQRGQAEAAVELIKQAIKLNPNQAAAYSNLGNALKDLKRHAEALACYDRALTLAPDYPEALFNRGGVLLDLKQYAEAVTDYSKALAFKPSYPEALNSRGIALLQLKRREEALADFDRALALKSDYAEALNNRGAILVDVRQYEGAAINFARLLAAAPDYKYALGLMLHARMHCCDWTDHAGTAQKIVNGIGGGKQTDLPLSFLAVSQSDAAQLQCARTYVSNKYPASASPLGAVQCYRHDKIRVAYVSADLREHAVSHLLCGLFERHDRQRFEVIAISLRPEDKSPIGLRVRGAFDQFIDVSDKEDLEIAKLMRLLEIDIAVDLMGFTQHARTGIFAYRPAPIQVNYLGYPGTLGAAYIDYIIADEFVIPASRQIYYAEKVVYLPVSFQANDDRREIAGKTSSRSEAGLPASAFVFCSFNRSYKINPALFNVWMRLLMKVSGSVLWLVAENESVQQNLRSEAMRRGVDPDRLIFADRLPYVEHLARLHLADLFLDSTPFNAGATASDALWAGVPMLTCAGEAFSSRMGGSLLNAAGLSQLITDSLEDYEAVALRLATTPGMLAEIAAQLASNRMTCALFATDRFRRHLESAYKTMWERSQRGEPPAGLVVQPIH
jgi:protein O-GlcNAc transferase